jgi:hypothetical protein
MVRRIGLVGEAAGMSCWQFCLVGLKLLLGGAPVKPESGKSGALKQPIRLPKTTQAPVTLTCLTPGVYDIANSDQRWFIRRVMD